MGISLLELYIFFTSRFLDSINQGFNILYGKVDIITSFTVISRILTKIDSTRLSHLYFNFAIVYNSVEKTSILCKLQFVFPEAGRPKSEVECFMLKAYFFGLLNSSPKRIPKLCYYQR